MRLVLATHNRGKLREFREILRSRLGEDLDGLELVSAADMGVREPKETGTTFEENSLLKARFVSRQTGLAAVADDSGLIVDVLGRAPGIISARWSGRHGDDKANVNLLLAQLKDIPDGRRTARFECVATLVVPPGVGSNRSNSEIVVAEHGEMTGLLARSPRGKNGFGYDPIFLPDLQPQKEPGRRKGEKTGASTAAISSPASPPSGEAASAALTTRLSTAQLSEGQKNAISHRGKALRKIARDIEVYLGSN